MANPTERQRFDELIAGARGTGRTTRMINAANEYAKEHPEQYVLVVAANSPEKRRLRNMLTEDNIHVCVPSDAAREALSYHVGFWDHYAAEQELRWHLDRYDQRVGGMIEYDWWKNPEEYKDWDE